MVALVFLRVTVYPDYGSYRELYRGLLKGLLSGLLTSAQTTPHKRHRAAIKIQVSTPPGLSLPAAC